MEEFSHHHLEQVFSPFCDLFSHSWVNLEHIQIHTYKPQVNQKYFSLAHLTQKIHSHFNHVYLRFMSIFSTVCTLIRGWWWPIKRHWINIFIYPFDQQLESDTGTSRILRSCCVYSWANCSLSLLQLDNFTANPSLCSEHQHTPVGPRAQPPALSPFRSTTHSLRTTLILLHNHTDQCW